MAITLNGSSNTITGLAVGGLPNGIVDTDMLADDAVTAAKRGDGSILQILYQYYDTEVSTTSTSYVDTGLSKSITPLKTGSRIIAIINQHIWFTRDTNAVGAAVRLMRDSTVAFQNAVNYQTWFTFDSGVTTTNWRGIIPLTHYDNHGISAGTAITYKTQVAAHVSTNSLAMKAQEAGSRSSMTLIEVDA